MLLDQLSQTRLNICVAWHFGGGRMSHLWNTLLRFLVSAAGKGTLWQSSSLGLCQIRWKGADRSLWCDVGLA